LQHAPSARLPSCRPRIFSTILRGFTVARTSFDAFAIVASIRRRAMLIFWADRQRVIEIEPGASISLVG
jgi:hypothetical protein